MAARGARAAARADAAHRRAHDYGADDPEVTGPPRGFPARAAAIGLDRRPQRADRYPLGRRRCRPHAQNAAELVALAPDVILASGSAPSEPLLQATRTVPIVFTAVADPVGAGFVKSLARPGGNTTGFTQFEFGMSGEMAGAAQGDRAGVTRVAVIRDAGIAAGIGQFAAIQAVGALVRRRIEPGQCA